MSASAMIAEAAMRANHLWSAGITCHGAHSVLVCESISEYAIWYSSQYSRSFDVGGGELPVLLGLVDAGQEPLALLLLARG